MCFLRRLQTYTPAFRFAFRQDCWYNKYIPSGRLCGQERSPLWKHLTRAQPCFICPVCLNFMTCMRRFCRFIVRIGSIFTTGAIGSIYGAPSDCLWAGGRVEYSDRTPREVLALTREYGISARLTLSNSLLRPEHLTDPDCNALCRLFQEQNDPQNGAIVHAELLTQYLKKNYPSLYLVSSTTKVLTDFNDLQRELARPEFRYVVPDFRLNRAFDRLAALPQSQKDKVEFLCNECCWFGCTERRACYEAVSRKNLGLPGPEHYCSAPGAADGYRFSRAMANPGFIGIKAIRDTYLPRGFTQFKIEGRGLGSALILEFLLHYLTKPEYQLAVREELYLDTMLDLF